MFKLDEKQSKTLDTWIKEQDKIAVEKQKSSITEQNPFYHIYLFCWEEGYPYTGAIGGGLTYSFSPTSLGIVVKVYYSLTDATIDLTDYDNW